MARYASPNKIKVHRIYTVWEAADALNKHRRTIIRWINEMGLAADKSQKPWLIKGTDLKVFLGFQRAAAKCKLSLHHIYCLGCRLPQEPAGKFADYTQQTATTGMLSALCPACECVMNKVVRRADLEAIRAKIEVTVRQADPRLVSRTHAPLNVTFTDEDQSDVKARK